MPNSNPAEPMKRTTQQDLFPLDIPAPLLPPATRRNRKRHTKARRHMKTAAIVATIATAAALIVCAMKKTSESWAELDTARNLRVAAFIEGKATSLKYGDYSHAPHSLQTEAEAVIDTPRAVRVAAEKERLAIENAHDLRTLSEFMEEHPDRWNAYAATGHRQQLTNADR